MIMYVLNPSPSFFTTITTTTLHLHSALAHSHRTLPYNATHSSSLQDHIPLPIPQFRSCYHHLTHNIFLPCLICYHSFLLYFPLYIHITYNLLSPVVVRNLYIITYTHIVYIIYHITAHRCPPLSSTIDTPTISLIQRYPTLSSSYTVKRISTDIPTVLPLLTALLFRHRSSLLLMCQSLRPYPLPIVIGYH